MVGQADILFLGASTSPLVEWLRGLGEAVHCRQDRIRREHIEKDRIGFIVSYGYRYMIQRDVLDCLPRKVINLHISFLPWNRGADPNFWSFVDGTPSGVTIHYVDEGLDTGEIIAQREVRFDAGRETLRTSYDALQAEVQRLFKENWAAIRDGTCAATRQIAGGTIHRLADKRPIFDTLPLGWDTPIPRLLDRTAHLRRPPVPLPRRLVLRPADRSDSADLLAWRNDPVTRTNSRNTGVVAPADHAAWLERALADANRLLWIAERGGETLGTVSALRGDDGAVELSVTVALAMRGRGVGTEMIRAALAEVATAWPGAVVRATVRVENAASRRLFERCGFVAVGESAGFLAYRFAG